MQPDSAESAASTGQPGLQQWIASPSDASVVSGATSVLDFVGHEVHRVVNGRTCRLRVVPPTSAGKRQVDVTIFEKDGVTTANFSEGVTEERFPDVWQRLVAGFAPGPDACEGWTLLQALGEEHGAWEAPVPLALDSNVYITHCTIVPAWWLGGLHPCRGTAGDVRRRVSP